MSSLIVAEWNCAAVIVPGATVTAPLEATAMGTSRNNESTAAIRPARGTYGRIGNSLLVRAIDCCNRLQLRASGKPRTTRKGSQPGARVPQPGFNLVAVVPDRVGAGLIP